MNRFKPIVQQNLFENGRWNGIGTPIMWHWQIITLQMPWAREQHLRCGRYCKGRDRRRQLGGSLLQHLWYTHLSTISHSHTHTHTHSHTDTHIKPKPIKYPQHIQILLSATTVKIACWNIRPKLHMYFPSRLSRKSKQSQFVPKKILIKVLPLQKDGGSACLTMKLLLLQKWFHLKFPHSVYCSKTVESKNYLDQKTTSLP